MNADSSIDFLVHIIVFRYQNKPITDMLNEPEEVHYYDKLNYNYNYFNNSDEKKKKKLLIYKGMIANRLGGIDSIIDYINKKLKDFEKSKFANINIQKIQKGDVPSRPKKLSQENNTNYYRRIEEISYSIDRIFRIIYEICYINKKLIGNNIKIDNKEINNISIIEEVLKRHQTINKKSLSEIVCNYFYSFYITNYFISIRFICILLSIYEQNKDNENDYTYSLYENIKNLKYLKDKYILDPHREDFRQFSERIWSYNIYIDVHGKEPESVIREPEFIYIVNRLSTIPDDIKYLFEILCDKTGVKVNDICTTKKNKYGEDYVKVFKYFDIGKMLLSEKDKLSKKPNEFCPNLNKLFECILSKIEYNEYKKEYPKFFNCK